VKASNRTLFDIIWMSSHGANLTTSQLKRT
jgi:hypothetical protein